MYLTNCTKMCFTYYTQVFLAYTCTQSFDSDILRSTKNYSKYT